MLQYAEFIEALQSQALQTEDEPGSSLAASSSHSLIAPDTSTAAAGASSTKQPPASSPPKEPAPSMAQLRQDRNSLTRQLLHLRNSLLTGLPPTEDDDREGAFPVTAAEIINELPQRESAQADWPPTIADASTASSDAEVPQGFAPNPDLGLQAAVDMQADQDMEVQVETPMRQTGGRQTKSAVQILEDVQRGDDSEILAYAEEVTDTSREDALPQFVGSKRTSSRINFDHFLASTSVQGNDKSAIHG